MSSIATDKGILHYEAIGRGKPVIFLHGWLGSWRLWQQTMVSMESDFRSYALDFWGFGESDRKYATYDLPDFVSLINQFMDQMGIEKAPLIGHSMGGTVSLLCGLIFKDCISKIAIVGSPIQGSSLALPLKLAGRKNIASLLYSNIHIFRRLMKFYSPRICSDPNFPAMMDNDITNTTLNSFLKSIASLRKTDLTAKIAEIHIPVMGMYGKNDNIVSPDQSVVLRNGIPGATVEMFPHSGHFIMLDEPQAFSGAIRRFLNIENP
jgi:pimeloyl-ACP methyl ester carboxylesterase